MGCKSRGAGLEGRGDRSQGARLGGAGGRSRGDGPKP